MSAEETEQVKTEQVKAEQETEKVSEEKPTAEDTVKVSKADWEKMQSALKKANAEAAARRVELKAKEDAEQEKKEAEMTEFQKLQQQIEALRLEAEEAKKQAKKSEYEKSVGEEAAKVGIDPEDALKFIGYGSEDLATALQELAKAKPYIVRKQSPRFSVTNPQGGEPIRETDEQKRKRLFG